MIETLAAILFALAIVHTFLAKHFEHLARLQPAHAGLWHLLGEVETVFGFWGIVLLAAMAIMLGRADALAYLNGLDFTEPAFVFVVMVIAASKPILVTTRALLERLASLWPRGRAQGYYFVLIAVAPLFGSLITEPATMTLAALLLRERYLREGAPPAFLYGTLAVLFVNVSIGGTLTAYAAPPVLMVADAWDWNSRFMLTTFGWKAAIAVLINAVAATAFFRADLAERAQGETETGATTPAMPLFIVLIHAGFLAAVVAAGHHAPVFIALFLLFLGVAEAYPQHQSPLVLREGLMVAFFLAGLVVLGGMQRWWLQPLLQDLPTTTLFFGAAALTALTDNAALTYLGSLVEGTSAEFRYALVAGAVAGGGLTVIANAPNPAGYALLRGAFDEGAVDAFKLLLAALPPTAVAIAAFLWLPGL